jgi:hypothetical protein
MHERLQELKSRQDQEVNQNSKMTQDMQASLQDWFNWWALRKRGNFMAIRLNKRKKQTKPDMLAEEDQAIFTELLGLEDEHMQGFWKRVDSVIAWYKRRPHEADYRDYKRRLKMEDPVMIRKAALSR